MVGQVETSTLLSDFVCSFSNQNPLNSQLFKRRTVEANIKCPVSKVVCFTERVKENKSRIARSNARCPF